MRNRNLCLMVLLLILAVPALAQSDLPLGQVVEAELAAEGDTYTFAYSDDQQVFLDLVATDVEDPTTVTWAILDAEETALFEGPLADMVTPLDLAAGEYTLRVTPQEGVTGTYSFQLWDVPAAEPVAVTLGEPVSGSIDSPGAINVFVLSVEGPVLLDLLSRDMTDPESAPVLMDWSVRAEGSEEPVYTAVLGDSSGVLPLEAGEYTLTVDASEDATGTYSFAVIVPPAAEELSAAIGETSIEGNLEELGASDLFSFEGSADQVVFIDLLSFGLTDPDGSPQVSWVLTAPSGAEVFNRFLGDTLVTLPETGTYTLLVDANDDETGPYSFRMNVPPAAETFTLSIGTAVSDGSPEAGMGNLEVAGAMDVYTITPDADSVILLDFNSSNITDPDGTSTVNWAVRDASGAVLYEAVLGDMNEPLALSAGETYELRVQANDDEVGTYAFAVLAVSPPQTFEIEVGDIISNNSPGMGELETAGAVDVYTFQGTANQSVRLELVMSRLNDPDGIPTEIFWTLTAPNGTVLYSELIGDSPGITLPATGIYTVTVDGNDDEIGSYIFAIFNVVP